MKYDRIDSTLFAENRKRFIKEMQPGSIAIIYSNDEQHKTADQNFPFKQNTDLFYLCGIDQEETVLVLFPDAPKPEFREMLFIKKTDELSRIWDGNRLEPEEASDISGIKTIKFTTETELFLPMLMHRAQHIYMTLNEHDRYKQEQPDRNHRMATELKKRFPLHQFHRSGHILHKLRTVKSSIEIDLIKHACGITGKAFHEIMHMLKPGVHEYEVEATIIHTFIKNRATGHAFHPIVASGASACVLHYITNNRQCKDGDLLLLDFGAEYANYASDMSRTIPVNGKYTPRQKEVYNAVRHAQKQSIELMQPGITLDEYNREAAKTVESALIDIGLLNKQDVAKQNPERPLYKKYFMHGVAHFMGLDVHDSGDRYEKLEAGAVLTCEPGIYIREEKIGIRIENDILITENGPVDLMKDIPVEADHIEEIMQG